MPKEPIIFPDDIVPLGMEDRRRIQGILCREYSIDISHYKTSTLYRCIQRRMKFNRIETINHYLPFLYSSVFEQKTFCRSFLVGLTQFFRNPIVFDLFHKNYIPKLLHSKKKDEPIRIWVAGCSSGEEAYSYAILFCDVMKKVNALRKVTIYATDVNPKIISKAAMGRYNKQELAGVSSELLSKYFTRTQQEYFVKEKIRNTIVFAKQNLVSDRPFSNMDIVSCRNTLIYFNSIAQKRVLEKLDLSLKDRGLLVLGNYESLIGRLNGYQVERQASCIYRPNRSSNRVNTFPKLDTLNALGYVIPEGF